MSNQDIMQHSMPKKRVSFSQDVLLYVDHQYSLKHRRSMFYTPTDYRTFNNELHIQVKLARAIGRQVLNQGYSLRGLEQLADETASNARRRRKHMGQLAVFMEQDRQLIEDGNLTPVDVESMAHRYGSVTKKSQELAQQRAVLDEQEVAERESIASLLPTSSKSTKTTVHRKPVDIAPKSRFSVVPSAA